MFINYQKILQLTIIRPVGNKHVGKEGAIVRGREVGKEDIVAEIKLVMKDLGFSSLLVQIEIILSLH